MGQSALCFIVDPMPQQALRVPWVVVAAARVRAAVQAVAVAQTVRVALRVEAQALVVPSDTGAVAPIEQLQSWEPVWSSCLSMSALRQRT